MEKIVFSKSFRKMVGTLTGIAVLTLTGMLLSDPENAHGKFAKEKIEKATIIITGPPSTQLTAGDSEKHILGLGQRVGDATFEDGRKGDYSNVYQFDWYQGETISIWGYSKIAFDDGSWFFFKFDSKFVGRDKDNNPQYKSNGVILKGSGRYEGVKGTVTANSRNVPPSDEHPKGYREGKVVISYYRP